MGKAVRYVQDRYVLVPVTRGHNAKSLMSLGLENQNYAQIINILYLTLYLLTWRIWSAPNNASKEQMGFNSEFKGLILITL